MEGKLGRALRRPLGIREDVLARTDDAGFYTLMVVLASLIAVIAGLFMGNAVLYALGPGHDAAAVIGGLAWAAVVFLIDMNILLPMPYTEPAEGEATDKAWRRHLRRPAKVLARVIVAAAIGYLIAEPLMATAFRRDVDADLPTAREAYETAVTNAGVEAGKLLDQEIATREDVVTDAEEKLGPAQETAEASADRCLTDESQCGRATADAQEVGRLQRTIRRGEEAIVRMQKSRTDDVQAAEAAFRADNELDETKYGPRSLGAWDRFAETHELMDGWIWVVTIAIVLIDTMVVLLKLLRGVTDYESELGRDIALRKADQRDREAHLAEVVPPYRLTEVEAKAEADHRVALARLTLQTDRKMARIARRRERRSRVGLRRPSWPTAQQAKPAAET